MRKLRYLFVAIVIVTGLVSTGPVQASFWPHWVCQNWNVGCADCSTDAFYATTPYVANGSASAAGSGRVTCSESVEFLLVDVEIQGGDAADYATADCSICVSANTSTDLISQPYVWANNMCFLVTAFGNASGTNVNDSAYTSDYDRRCV